MATPNYNEEGIYNLDKEIIDWLEFIYPQQPINIHAVIRFLRRKDIRSLSQLLCLENSMMMNDDLLMEDLGSKEFISFVNKWKNLKGRHQQQHIGMLCLNFFNNDDTKMTHHQMDVMIIIIIIIIIMIVLV